MLTTAPYIRIASALQGDGEACAPLLIKFICPTTTLFIYLLKTLQYRGLLQGLIKPREIEFSCEISTGQYQSSSVDLSFFFFQA